MAFHLNHQKERRVKALFRFNLESSLHSWVCQTLGLPQPSGAFPDSPARENPGFLQLQVVLLTSDFEPAVLLTGLSALDGAAPFLLQTTVLRCD